MKCYDCEKELDRIEEAFANEFVPRCDNCEKKSRELFLKLLKKKAPKWGRAMSRHIDKVIAEVLEV